MKIVQYKEWPKYTFTQRHIIYMYLYNIKMNVLLTRFRKLILI